MKEYLIKYKYKLLYGLLFTVIPSILQYHDFFRKSLLKINLMEYMSLIKSLLLFFSLWIILIAFWKISEIIKLNKKRMIELQRAVFANHIHLKVIRSIIESNPNINHEPNINKIKKNLTPDEWRFYKKNIFTITLIEENK